jgi:hypothetical protein
MQLALGTQCHGLAGQHAVSEALNLGLGWVKDFQLLGLYGFMQAEQTSVTNSVFQAIAVCWADATKPCMDWKNPSQVGRVISIARLAAFFNYRPWQFNPWAVRKCVGCEWAEVVSDWAGRGHFSYEQHSSHSEYGSTTTADVARSATMEFGMSDAADWGGRQRWNGSGASGTGNFNDRVVVSSQFGSTTQTWIGSGPLTQLSPPTGHAKMDIDTAGCKYSVEFRPYLDVVYTSGSEQSRLARGMGTPYLFELPLPDAAGRVLSGMLVLPTTVDPMQSQNTSTHFYFGGTAAAAELEYALGKGNLGTAQVEWALSPAPFE